MPPLESTVPDPMAKPSDEGAPLVDKARAETLYERGCARLDALLDFPQAGMVLYGISIIFRTLVGILCKVALNHGAFEMTLLLVRAAGGFLLALATCTAINVHPFGTGEQNELLLFNGSIGGLTGVGTTMTFSHLSLLLSNIIPLSAPIVSTVLAYLLLKERISRDLVMSVLPSLLGTLIIVQPWDKHAASGTSDSIGLAWAYIVLFGRGVGAVGNRLLLTGEKAQSPYVLMVYGNMMCGLGVFVYAYMWRWEELSLVCVSTGCLAPLLLIVLLAFLDGVCVCNALMRGHVGKVEAMNYLGIVIAAAADYLVFNVAITLSMVVGGSFIMLGAWLIFSEVEEDDEGNLMNVLERLDADKVEEILFPDQGDEETRSLKSTRSPRASQYSQYGGLETGADTDRSKTTSIQA